MPPFPVDPQTLDLIEMAIRPGPEAERSSLGDLCVLMTALAAHPDVDSEALAEYHPHDIIASLVDEVRRLRPADPDAGLEPAHVQVHDYIRSLGNQMPHDVAHRNAMIWRGVGAALEARQNGETAA